MEPFSCVFFGSLSKLMIFVKFLPHTDTASSAVHLAFARDDGVHSGFLQPQTVRGSIPSVGFSIKHTELTGLKHL